MQQAIGYVRVSTEEQSKEGVSLEAQQERIRAYAAMRGLELVHIYVEQGVSGKIPLRQRPEGMKLVQAISKKRAKHVLTLKLDRLFRSAADALDQTARWDKGKIALHIIDMGGAAIDTASAMGKMFFTMMAGFAEMERNLISERTRTALQHKKSASRVYSRLIPLGFDRDGDKLVPNKEEMKTVRRVLKLRSQGLSMQSIADALNQAGAATKQGGRWHAVTIQKILKIHTAPEAA
jgi:site-specific DNA recombinase